MHDKLNLKSSSGHEQLASTGSANSTRLITDILNNPVAFVSDPQLFIDPYSDSEFGTALDYFSVQQADRFLHSICTAFIENKVHDIGAKLQSAGFSDSPLVRFWPFWYSSELISIRNSELVQKHLLHIWNSLTQKNGDYVPGLFFQTGFIEPEKCQTIEGLIFCRFLLPLRKSVDKKPYFITVAFHPETGGFYTADVRIRSDAQRRFKHVEFVRPHVQPPDLRHFLMTGERRQWNVMVVLDRHIGDSLSLLTTHLPYLAEIPQFNVVVDASACPLFYNASWRTFSRFLPKNVSLIRTVPVDRSNFDLVFDPYDWISDMFSRKVQNDSCAAGIVSGLEYARWKKLGHRRYILDIHLEALKRMGVVEANTRRPEFLQCRISAAERSLERRNARTRILAGSPRRETAKIITFFPFGDDDYRRYPVEQLQNIIRVLLSDPDVHIVVAGNQYDTPEIVQTLRNDWEGVPQPCLPRIKAYLDESFERVIGLILASDVVVSMDSGPLHIARSLRVNPIGLYAGWINNTEFSTYCPWIVEDDTLQPLKPPPENNPEDNKKTHVPPGMILSAVRKRLLEI